jgi:hypothetical protein
MTDIQESIQALAGQARIQNTMNINTFLNPTDEVVDDDDDEVLDQLVDAYAEGDRAEETDEEPVEVVPIGQSDAIQAVQLLQQYEEQQEDGDSELLRHLARLQITVRGRMVCSLEQAPITSYFT